jgi:signal transduction histidine kinase
MFHNFLTREKKRILTNARQKALGARWGRIRTDAEDGGWDYFYDELTSRFKSGEGFVIHEEDRTQKATSKEYLRLGFAITEAVQSYNILYQAITDSADELGFTISVEDQSQLKVSLDIAIAEVVAEFEREKSLSQGAKETERLGFLAHELRNSLQSASIALELVESGAVGLQSKTGGLLRSSLQRMAELVDTALTSVRLQVEPEVRLERVAVYAVMSEVEATASFQSNARGLQLRMQAGSLLMVLVDRPLFVSALSNIVQNALKFTQPGGSIGVTARKHGDRILIEVEDQCGGLPDGKIEELFQSGVQMGADRTGVGLGLAITRQALERNNGMLRVTNLPGKGCIFTIDLPDADSVTSPMPSSEQTSIDPNASSFHSMQNGHAVVSK